MNSTSQDDNQIGDDSRNSEIFSLKKRNTFVEPSNATETEPPPEDGRYGWIVVAAAFCCHFIALGYLYSFGVFILPLSTEFQVGRGVVSWVGSLTNATVLYRVTFKF